jgi:tetratricopeptide (TPR) repeat protein
MIVSITSEVRSRQAPTSQPLRAARLPNGKKALGTDLINVRRLIDANELHLAKDILARFLAQEPNHSIGLRYLAEVFLKKSENKNAETVLDYLAKTARFYFDHKFLAHSFYILSRDEKAAVHYELVLENIDLFSSIDQFEIFKNLGNIYVRSGDFEAAEEVYNKAHCLFPQSDILQVNLATLAVQRQSFTEALERYREALNHNPRNANAFVGVALVHYQMGEMKLAIANLESALDMDPRHQTAMDLLMKWTLRMDSSESVLARACEFLAADNSNASEISHKLALHFHLLGKSELAGLEEMRARVLSEIGEKSD